MLGSLIFSNSIIKEITEFYEENCDKERILVLLLEKHKGCICVMKMLVPQETDYRITTKNNTSLFPQYVFSMIKYTIANNFAGIMLMHNHINGIPLFSRDDRRANKKFFHFFSSNQIDLIAGSAVYANNRISYVTDCRLLRRAFCVKISELGDLT